MLCAVQRVSVPSGPAGDHRLEEPVVERIEPPVEPCAGTASGIDVDGNGESLVGEGGIRPEK